MADIEAFTRGELSEPLAAEMIIGESRTAIDLSYDGNTIRSAVIEHASNPASIVEQERQFRTPQDGRFTISLHKSRYSHPRALLSILKSAYLLTFAAVGYQFIPSARRIREQLLHPSPVDELLTKNLIRFDRDAPATRRQLAMITEPRDRLSMYVTFGRWTALIPLSADSAFYKPASGSFKFSGSELEIPTQPVFGLTSDEIARADALAV